MAVNQTGAIYKAMTIDGASSRTYGVYITGQAVYNAPQREVEMISIPGRNGQLALDKGRFENIEVTYPAGIYADTEADFAEAVSNFRNFLCSRDGYVRIEDEYNPNEYRMGVYKSGLEVTPAMLKAGEFEITFDCKPQRWLKSGETAVTVDSGDVISNPTLFESSPMLEVEGYGTVGFNGYEIEIENGTLGEVDLWEEYTDGRYRERFTKSVTIASDLLNSGDPFYIDGYEMKGFRVSNGATAPTITSYTHSGVPSTTISCWGELSGTSSRCWIDVKFPRLEFEIGTPLSFVDQEHVYYTYQVGGYTMSDEIYIENGVEYDGDGTVTFYQRSAESYKQTGYSEYTIPKGIGISSAIIMGHPTYIDCDFGEAYKVESGQYISLNRYIDLGSDLPKLSTGANTITFDNTITELKVRPRWWKV